MRVSRLRAGADCAWAPASGAAVVAGLTLGLLALLLMPIPAGGAQPAPAGAGSIGDGRGGIELRRIAKMKDAVHVEAAPGRGNRRLLFVVQKGGTVLVIRRGKLRRRPFLDIANRVRTEGHAGLLSIAFAPNYAKSRLFYVFYVNSGGNIQISRFLRSTASKLWARPRSERTVIEVPHPPGVTHYGGQVAVGPDGKLWFATGDGGPDCDPDKRAQDPDTLLGKLLRVAPRPDGGYSIPADNPNVGGPGRDEIYASGLRSPFRFSFDRLTGDITLADVGEDSWEEINHLSLDAVRGANFGWSAFEGTRPLTTGCDEFESSPAPANHTPPIHEYAHPEELCASVTGGLVVRDRKLTSLYGRYLYADLCDRRIRSLIASPGAATGDRPAGVRVRIPTSLSDGRKNRVYVTSLARGVYRVRDASAAQAARPRR